MGPLLDSSGDQVKRYSFVSTGIVASMGPLLDSSGDVVGLSVAGSSAMMLQWGRCSTAAEIVLPLPRRLRLLRASMEPLPDSRCDSNGLGTIPARGA